MREYLERVRETSPLIHNITNYVTVNDCANILLACGGSPIMADDPEEAEEITSICGGLNINIGTLNQHTISAMVLAGRKANLCGHPVLLDPVGAGASSLRTETARKLLEEVDFAVIRGNISEIKALAGGGQCRQRSGRRRGGRGDRGKSGAGSGAGESLRRGHSHGDGGFRSHRSGVRWGKDLYHPQRLSPLCRGLPAAAACSPP